MAKFNIDERAIDKMQQEIVKEFEMAARKHPIRVPIEVPFLLSAPSAVRGSQAISTWATSCASEGSTCESAT
ncbi:hypothetical protein OG241_27135 [Streptomyces sp. NBC_01390]|uniref:hypothetical protein n=1 Tax=Streptomyces sp. NBC_01390 TaxID=2903850 RepID=UPI00324E1889